MEPTIISPFRGLLGSRSDLAMRCATSKGNALVEHPARSSHLKGIGPPAGSIYANFRSMLQYYPVAIWLHCQDLQLPQKVEPTGAKTNPINCGCIVLINRNHRGQRWRYNILCSARLATILIPLILRHSSTYRYFDHVKSAKSNHRQFGFFWRRNRAVESPKLA